MAEAKRKTTTRQVIDVHKPGKTPVDDTAKPVIVSNRAIMRDPMVTAEATTPVTETKSVPPLPSKVLLAPIPEAALAEEKPASETETLELAPIAGAEESATAEPEKPAELKHEVVITPPSHPKEPDAEEAKDEPAAEEPKDDAPTPTDATSEAAIEAADEEAEAKREVELQKIIEKKQYFLPINAVEQRRAEQFIALGVVLSLVLGLAWLDISLDAGLIHIDNIHAVTHFFSN